MSTIERNEPCRTSSSGEASTALAVLVGADRTCRLALGLATATWLVASAGLGWSARTRLDGAPIWQDGPVTGSDWRDALERIMPTPFAVVVVVGAVVLIGLVLLVERGLPRARLELAPTSATLRHQLGTAKRRVADVDLVMVGDLVARETIRGDDVVELSVGTYLRLANRAHRRGAITVGCLTANDLHRRWTNFTPGPDVRKWDLTLEPAAFSALQDVLASQGLLAPTDRPLDHATYVRARWSMSDWLVIGVFAGGLIASIVMAVVR